MHGFIPIDVNAYPTQLALPPNTNQMPYCRGAHVTKVDHVSLWLQSPTPELMPDTRKIVEEYLARGISGLEIINAGAIILLHDHHTTTTYLAIDSMGIASVACSKQDNGIYFSSDALHLAELLNRSSIASQQVFDYLFFHMIPAPGSIFQDIEKLLPAHVIEVSKGSVSNSRYWYPKRVELRSNAMDPHQQLHNTLEQAVARCANQQGATGAFLSGGLDSSTVSGYLSKIIPNVSTFSIGFNVEGYDELEYARIANSAFSATGHELVLTAQHIIDDFSDIAKAYSEPFGNSSVVPTYACAKLAKAHGVDRLLAGDGGDELFAGNERYAKQKVFELYNILPAALRNTVIKPLMQYISQESRLTPLRKLRSYVDQASVPLPNRFETWNFAYREGIGTMLNPDFAKKIDIESPMRVMGEAYHETATDDLIDSMLAYDWKFTLADNDLRKVGRICEHAEVEVCFPMLDRNLVDFSLSIPGDVKLKGTKLRAFYRDAMKDFLPQQILNKTKHGFGMPFGIWLKQNKDLADMIFTRLERIKSRGIFQDGFINNLIESQKTGHANYYGYFVWDLAMLEEWLTVHHLSA